MPPGGGGAQSLTPLSRGGQCGASPDAEAEVREPDPSTGSRGCSRRDRRVPAPDPLWPYPERRCGSGPTRRFPPALPVGVTALRRIRTARPARAPTQAPLEWGAADYFARGLAVPESVRAATTAYESGQNTVAGFVEDCAEIGDPNAQHMKVRSSEVRSAYERWCLDEGVEPVPARSFTLALKSQFGVQSERSNTARYLAGIRLVEASPDASRPAPSADDWFNQEGW